MISALEVSIEKTVVPAVSVASIAHFIKVCVKRSGGDLVQQWFPYVGPVSFDQNDVEIDLAEPRAQATHQFKPAGSSAHDHDLGFHGSSQVQNRNIIPA
jgi:hypothetical protein